MISFSENDFFSRKSRITETNHFFNYRKIDAFNFEFFYQYLEFLLFLKVLVLFREKFFFGNDYRWDRSHLEPDVLKRALGSPALIRIIG